MLKRRPSKRFVLAETGEEPSWDITMDNGEGGGSKVTSPVPPLLPVINLETAVPSGSTSASSSVCEDCPPEVGGSGNDSGASGSGSSGGNTGAGELKVPALHNLKLTESGRLK